MTSSGASTSLHSLPLPSPHSVQSVSASPTQCPKKSQNAPFPGIQIAQYVRPSPTRLPTFSHYFPLLALLLIAPATLAVPSPAAQRAAFKLLDSSQPDEIDSATWALQDCYTPENLNRLRTYTTDAYSIPRKPLNWPLSIERAQTRYYPRRAVAYTVGRILWNQEMPGPPIEEPDPLYRDLPRTTLLTLASALAALLLLARLRWRGFRLFTAASTLAALLICFFWFRSFRNYDNVAWSTGGQQYEIASTLGNISICTLRDGAAPAVPRISSLTPTSANPPWRKGWLYLADPRTCWWPRRNQGNLISATGTFTIDDIPFWMLLAPFMILPAWYVIGPARKRDRARRWVRAGCCPQCGYDLRATPRNCPECGWSVNPP